MNYMATDCDQPTDLSTHNMLPIVHHHLSR